MSNYKVLTDGNGSDLIQVVGLGIYVPLSGLEKVSADNVVLSKNLRAAQHKIETTQSALKRVSDYVVRLENDNYALASQVEALRKAIIEYDDCDTASQSKKACRDMIALAKATPQQRLRDVRAEAGRAGFIAGYHKMHIDFFGSLAPEESAGFAADQYAERVKAGEQK